MADADGTVERTIRPDVALANRADWPRRGPRTLTICLLLFFLALAPRIGHALLHRHDPPGGDEPEYVALAAGLSQGGGYTSQQGFSLAYYSPRDFAPTAYRAPGFPAVLAASYVVFGQRVFPARVLLVILNALGAVLLFLLAREVCQDRRAAMLAGAAWAVWPASVYHIGTASSTLGPEGVAVPLLLLALLLLARSLRRGSLLLVAVGGLVLGVCTLTRSNLLFAAAFSAAWLVYAWWGPRGWRRACLAACLLVVACLAVVAPWIVRNYVRLGVTTIATQTDVLFFGNNPWARGAFSSEGGKLYDVIAPYKKATLASLSQGAGGGDGGPVAARIESEQFRFLEERHPGFLMRSEAEKFNIYKQEALAYAAANPRRMAWLLYRKAVLFWLPLHEARAGYDYSFMYGFMLPYFAVGTALAVVRRRPGLLLMLIPLLANFATAILVFGLPRYRYVAEPAMLVLAASGASAMAARYSWPRTAAVALAWFIINLVVAFMLAGNRVGL